MNIPINGKIRNYIFIFVLLVVILALMADANSGARQDRAFRLNYVQYQNALGLVNQRQYADAQVILAQLDQNSLSSWQVLYTQGVCALNTGDLASADDYMQKAREVRPALLESQDYLVSYGIVLYKLGEYDRAKAYLRKSKNYNNNLEKGQEADKYLGLIAAGERGINK